MPSSTSTSMPKRRSETEAVGGAATQSVSHCRAQQDSRFIFGRAGGSLPHRGIRGSVRRKFLTQLYAASQIIVHVTELQKALAEIRTIRDQMARGMEFRGYGPCTLAATGVLALLAALGQSHWLPNPAQDVGDYLRLWTATAAVSFTVVLIETVLRAQRVHSTLAPQMVRSALEQFLPAIVAGLLLTVVLVRRAEPNLWMLPGLWQLIFGLGVFASCRVLPRQMFAVGLWYLSAGLVCLALGDSRALSPWAMGIPFGVGQMLVAAVLQFCYREPAAA